MPSVNCVGSDAVESVAYNPLALTCEVTFKGGRKYRYSNVESSDVLQLLFSGSPGRYMHSVFKRKYVGVEVLSARRPA